VPCDPKHFSPHEFVHQFGGFETAHQDLLKKETQMVLLMMVKIMTATKISTNEKPLFLL